MGILCNAMTLYTKPSQGGQQLNKHTNEGGGEGFGPKLGQKTEKWPKPNFLNTFLSGFSFCFFCILFYDSWNLIMDKFYNRQNNKSYSFFLVSFCWNHFFSPSCTVRYVLSDTHKLDFSSFLPISFTFHLVHCYNPQKEKTAGKCLRLPYPYLML